MMKVNGLQVNRSRRAFLVTDAIVALFIIGGLISMFGLAVNLHQRNADHLAHQRRALAAASLALASLQSSSQATIPNDSETLISIQRSGKQVGNLEWVQVTATHAGRRASLAGLARSATQPGALP